MSRKLRRRLVVVACSLAIVCAVATRTFFAFVPRGVTFLPWVLASVEGPELRSPDGQRNVRVYFNDAGAAHSGNHWTWVVENSWLLGRRVVIQGYLDTNVREGIIPVPASWGPDNHLSVKFLLRRYQTPA